MDIKKPLDMYLDGWCENCDGKISECIDEAMCMGYKCTKGGDDDAEKEKSI